MWMKKLPSAEIERRDYQREVFRSSVVSLFWNILAFRKKHSGFTQSALAERIGVHKSAPSRWFAGDKPNWEENTMSDIADALDVELEIFARDRKTGQRFAPYGPIVTPVHSVKVVADSKLQSFAWNGDYVQPSSKYPPEGMEIRAAS